MKYLADTSALVRIMRRQVDAEWREVAARGLIAICEPVLTETLTIADAKSYDRAEADIARIYPWVPVPGQAWDLIRVTRRELAKHAMHNALSVADYLVAATAIQLKLVVLHEDNDFCAVAGVLPQLSETRISGGPPAS